MPGRALGALGLLSLSLTAGVLGAGELRGVQATLGPASVEGGALVLPAGSQVVLGEGEALELELDMAGADLDLVRGPVDAPLAFAHFDDQGLGLFDGQGDAISRGTPQAWRAGERRTLRLSCRPPLLIEVDGRSLDVSNGSERPCGRALLSVRANRALRVQALRVDGQRLPIAQTRVDLPTFTAVAGSSALAALALGAGPWAPLLASPLALLAPAIGLPPTAVLLLLVAASAFGAALERASWRRALAAALCLGGLAGAGAAVLQAQRPAGNVGGEAHGLARALSRRVDASTFLQKVDDAAAWYGPRLAALPDDGRPLLIALGSSSTGGNSHGRFWPEVLGEALPELRVFRMAWGGMTTWHVRKLLDRLDVSADYCALYMGHNDLTATSPGGTLRQFEEGRPPGLGFVAPVPLDDARDNLRAIAARCGLFVAMDERSMEAEAALAGYRAMLQAEPGVLYVDGKAALERLPAAVGMVDAVHPSPKGHQVLGQHLAEALRPHLQNKR